MIRSQRSLAGALMLALAMARGAAAATPITAAEAWIRETLPGKTVTAAFVKLANGGDSDDALLEATSAAVRSIELHHMKTGSDGVMSMERVPSIALPKGGTTALAPGGLHMMLFGTKTEMRAGSKVRILLRFAHADPIEVEFEVRPVVDDSSHAHQH